MMIRTGEKFVTGIQDKILILLNEQTGTYHCAFFEEKPLPGSYLEPRHVTRVMCRMSHTTGSKTLEGAKHHVAELRATIIVDDRQVFLEPISWDGRPGMVILTPPVEPVDPIEGGVIPVEA